jgi:hypothetical protein
MPAENPPRDLTIEDPMKGLRLHVLGAPVKSNDHAHDDRQFNSRVNMEASV